MNNRTYTTPPALTREAVPGVIQQAVVAYTSRNWAQAEQLCRSALQIAPDYFDALNLLGAITAQTERQPEAVALLSRAVAARPAFAPVHCNYGNVLRELQQFDAAVASYDRAIALKPDFAEAYSNRGNALKELGQLDAAVASYDQAIALRPDYALAHLNRGNAFDALNQPEAALACYDRAITINADYALAYFNRGVMQQALGHMEAALLSYKRAAALMPAHAEAHNKLGNASKLLGRFIDAESNFRKALALDPELKSAKTGYAECVAAMEFHRADPLICATTARALAEAWVRPSNLAPSACNLIVLGLRKKNILPPSQAPQPLATTVPDRLDATVLAQLDEDALLLALLSGTPVVSTTLEDFLTLARHCGLAQAVELSTANGVNNAADAGTRFYCALAGQCFINEYVFSHSQNEIEAAGKLKDALVAALENNGALPAQWVTAVACYFPLHSIAGAEKLLARTWPDAVNNLLTLQIQEPLEELRLRPTIPRLTPFEDDVSLAVQRQYEENPFPRWIKNPQPRPPQALLTYLRTAFPFTEIETPDNTQAPEILIAGCGTGQHPIDTAQFVQGATILAIDLSLASLSYAKRKALEYNIQSIDFAQADILKLDALGRSFDVIESSGVLHHLAKPLEGWRLLLSLLRPKGFMKLGFYSELARRDIVKVRDLISARGFAPTPDGIRALRQYLRQLGQSENLGSALCSDFFSTSNCRDLLFHVQEHRMTLDLINAFLQENHLAFLGFQFDSPVMNAYRLRFPDDRAGINLDHWKVYEREYPNTFFGMYQFWVQKR